MALFFDAFNKPYILPKRDKSAFVVLRAILGGRLRESNNGEIESEFLVLLRMSYQDTQPNGVGLKIYTMDSLFVR